MDSKLTKHLNHLIIMHPRIWS